MAITFKSIWRDYGAIGVLLIAAGAYAIYVLVMNLQGSSRRPESMSDVQNPAYKNTTSGGSNMNSGGSGGSGGSDMGYGSSTRGGSIQNPADLLPKDDNSSWADLNPSGKGELANVNLLQAGYHVGINTVGQSMRNPNLQIRSEPPNPQINTGAWNQSTMTPDVMRPPLEIGSRPAY